MFSNVSAFLTLFLVLPIRSPVEAREITSGIRRNQEHTYSTVNYPDSGLVTTSPYNPSRGLYWQISYYASNPVRLGLSDLLSKRTSEGFSILLRLYYLDTCINPDTDISQDILDDIAADFDVIDSSGLKVIVRFAYSDPNANPQNTVHDPEKSQLLYHIDQLAPILAASEKIILVIQAGFIGKWGEWNGSTNFNPDWDGRKEIVAKLLNSVSNTMVQLRTPRYKQTIYPPTIYPPYLTFGLNQVQQSSFEQTDIWGIFGEGYSESTDSFSGAKSIRVDGAGAASQYLSTDILAGSTIKISGYSKAINAAVSNPNDYSIYVDLTYDDNTYLYGQTAQFSTGNHDWEYKESIFWVSNRVVAISLYAMYRNAISDGYALFDDISLHVSTTTSITPVVTLPIDSSNAHDGSHFARTGHHNDCFLASLTDYGTYVDIENEYPYLHADTKYTIMGGETCAVSNRTDCDTAKQELAMFHYTYLNSDYHPDVIASWIDGDCMNEIKARLGYRLVLQSGIFADTSTVGGEFDYNLTVSNTGYSAPINPHYVELVLRNSVTGEVCFGHDETIDARKWYGGEVFSISGIVRLPFNMQGGIYDLLLHITDSDQDLRDRDEYKVHVANDSGNLNEESTGYIQLLHSIIISGDGSSSETSPGAVNLVCEVGPPPLSSSPTSTPTVAPTAAPTASPTTAPTATPTAAPTNALTRCEDSGTPIYLNGNVVTCAQVATANKCSVVAAASHCPDTCGACDAYGCEDSLAPWNFYSYNLDCDFLSNLNPSTLAQACRQLPLSSTCRDTCDFCGN